MSGRSHSLEEARTLARAYHEFGEAMLANLPGFTSHGGWEYALQLATIGLTRKACCTARAILLLLHDELVGEAQVLQRVLVELAVTVLAIGRAKDPGPTLRGLSAHSQVCVVEES